MSIGRLICLSFYQPSGKLLDYFFSLIISISISNPLIFHSYEFLRTPATNLSDGGRELLEKQSGFQLVNPTEDWFPGLNDVRKEYASWDWRFGKSPKFSVVKSVQLKSATGEHDFKVQVTVDKVTFNFMTYKVVLLRAAY